MSGRFGLIVEFEVRQEQASRFRELICENASASLNLEPGCLQFDVLTDAQDTSKFVLYEIYDDNRAFEVHVGMEHVKTFFEAARPLIISQTARKLERVFAGEAD